MWAAVSNARVPPVWRTMLRLGCIAGVLATASCGSNLPQKPVQRAILVGVIRDPENNPIPGLDLELIFSPRVHVFSGPFHARTDSLGAFRFDAVEGIYELEIGSGYDYRSGFSSVQVRGIRLQP